MALSELIASAEKAEELIKRCYDVICRIAEQADNDTNVELNSLETDLYRHLNNKD